MESAGRQVDDAVSRSIVRNHDGPTPRVKQQVIAEGGPDLDALPDNLRSSGKTVRARNAWTDVDPAIRDTLTTSQQTELLRHLGEHPDGVRLVNDLGPEETESLFSLTYRNADGAELRANLFQRYAREQLDQTSRTTFARLTGDPDVQKSWLRAAGAANIKHGNVEKTVKRVEDLESDGHGVLEFHRSDELNPDFDGRPPHADNEIVTDFDINGEKTLYRVRDADFAVGGTWAVELNVLRNAETKSEIIDKLALLPNEWNREYTKVSKLETSQVEKDARLRVSTTGEMSVPERGVHRNGGIRQYKVHTGDKEYVESGWETYGDLSDFVNVEE